MIQKVVKRSSTEQVLSLMHPVVSEWFRDKFKEVTEAQSMAVPIIHNRQNVLVSSPTGSGKTLTAFLAVLNELILKAEKGELEDRIYAVYVSPLKALANDINENLLNPLSEISSLFESKGLTPPQVRVAVRTGDTLPSERQRQVRSPPHIFITTPESLALVLSTPVFSKKFEKVDYVVVDEVHEVCDSKRGVALSLSLERLQNMCASELVRIGLSATVAPIEQVAEFLVGQRDGRPRSVKIVEVFQQRDLDLRVICPAKDMTALSYEVVNSKMYDLLKGMIDEHKTTLVFTNTRSGTESVVYKLKERGLEQVGTHHGSLSRETRLDVETELRAGALKSVVSSTSLELGIDIGHIDLVIQIGSPKSVAKGLQRVGRSGHQYGGTSKGRIIVFETDDLVECAVLCRAAHRKMIDRVTIPMSSLDVLAQVIVGLSIERPWKAEEAFELIRRSYCYKDLTMEQFDSVLRYLGGKDEFAGVYSKIWFDDNSMTFGKKRGSRMIYYLNQGTIPEEADYKVFSERGSMIGSLSEKFVERLSSGDIFVLGGRSYEFIKTKGTKAFVKSASGRKPTVPSWTGEMLPRSFDLSVLVAEFRNEMDGHLEDMTEAEVSAWLMKEFDVDEGSATTIINYFREQKMLAKVPTNERLVIEGYIDQSGNKNAVFHFPFGRRVNDALSRAYAHGLSSRLRSNVTVSVTDDSFMLTAPKNFKLEDFGGMVSSSSLEQMLRGAVRDSELFSQRFRHTATRSFMVLRNYKGKELSVARQQIRSQRLLDALHEIDSFPVMTETYSEILTEVMDLENAQDVLASIEDGRRRIEYIPFSGVPSPFAHNVILVGVSDIVLMEDRSMLLRELHRKVLSRVLGEEAVAEYQFDPDEVAEYYASKFPKISSKQGILDALEKSGPMSLFREKGESVFSRSKTSFDRLRQWSSELLREGKVRSVWIGEEVYVSSKDYNMYACVHRKEIAHSPLESEILSALQRSPMTQADLVESLGRPRADVKEALRRLETANGVFRSGLQGESYEYSAAPQAGIPDKHCVEDAVRRHLTYHAPITVEDVAYEVGISEQDAEQALRELTREEIVVSGRFVVGEQQQYMLSRDYLKLKSKDQPVFDRDTVRAYTERKQFEKMPSIRSLFEKFGEAGMIFDVFQRVRNFDMAEFGRMRDSGELLLGRFVRGRLRYVLADDVPFYLAAYRKEGLDKYESAIRGTIERLGSGTYQQIAEASGFPPDLMREHFDSLDRKSFLVRLYDEAESWSSRNIYALCDAQPADKGALEHVLTRYVRGFGPVTVLQAATYLDSEPDEARKLLARVGAVPITVGLERTEMYLMPNELPELEREFALDETVHILSLYDPFLSDKWTEITSRFGEGWIFPVVHHGKIVGMVEKWLMAGSVEIREIYLDDPGMLGRLVDSIDSMMAFYNALNVDIVRVRSILGTEVGALSPEVRQELLRGGYQLANGMLVKGRLVTPCFEQSDLLDVMFSLQNLEPSTKLKDIRQFLRKYGGIRSDREVIIRVSKFEPVNRLHKKGEVMRGHLIPDRVGYCWMDDASLYRAARLTKMDSDKRLVMRIIKDQQPIKRERLLTLSPLGHGDTLESLRSVYSASQVYLDFSLGYVATQKTRMTRQNAWPIVLKRLFDNFGVFSAESLAMLIGHEIPMKELRRALRRLEDEGCLVKGFLLRGSDTLLWARKEAFAMLGATRFAHEFVLSPGDQIIQYLRCTLRSILPETGRFAVFSGSKVIGSFAGKMRNGKLEISDIQGEPRCDKLISDYARKMGSVAAGHDSGRIPDWEIIEFYQKSHPGVG